MRHRAGLVGALVSAGVAMVALVAPSVASANLSPVGTLGHLALSSACQSALAKATAAASTSTGPSVAQSIVFSAPTTLTNPTSPSATSASESLTIPFTVYGAAGTAVMSSVARPVTISIYDAPTGSITTTPAGVGTSPIVVTVSRGSSFSLSYNGSYLSRPLTVTAAERLASTNTCTNTTSRAIGTTTLSLANPPSTLGTASYTTPTNCHSGTSGSACATLNVDTRGLSLMAAVGYGASVPSSPAPATAPTDGQLASYTVDTGSIGTMVPYTQLGPDSVGPGPAAMKYYDSSGNEFVGYIYLAPVTLQMGASQATSVPIRVLAVLSSACHVSSKCKSPPAFSGFRYLGVGFDRGGTSTADPFASPRDNAFLAIEPPTGQTMSQGYLLSGSSITTGITSADSTGFSLETMSASSSVPGDWLGAPACVSFATPAPPAATPVCGSMLLDVGIPQMYITFSSRSSKPPVVAGGLPANQMISITAPNASSPVLSYSFSSGPVSGGSQPPAIGMAPSFVGMSVAPGGSPTGFIGLVFINTGRHVLFENQYLFDAQTGQVGFAPLAMPLR